MSDDDTFPLMDVPYPANERIIQQMDLDKVIELTLTSKNFKTFMNKISIPVNDFEMDFIIFKGSIWREHPPADIYFETVAINLEDPHFRGTINGKEVVCQRDRYTFSMDHPFEEVCAHLLSFLKPIDCSLECNYSPILFNSFDRKIIRKWKSMEVRFDYTNLISGDELKIIVADDIYKLFLNFPYETLKEIEDNMEAIKKLGNDGKHGKLKPIKIKEFVTTVVDFITLEDILDSESRAIHLTKLVSPFSASQLNKLLKEWKTGNKMANLQSFEMSYYKQDVQLFTDSSTIVEGIDLHEEKPTDWLFTVLYGVERDCFGNLGGMTIKRDTDGMLATLWITIDKVVFYIWVRMESDVDNE